MAPHVLLILLIAYGSAVPTANDRSADQRPAATAAAQSQPSTQPATEPIVIAGEKFRLEIAADDAAREKGLMGRDHIDDSAGMLFIFPQPKELSFWMANCIIDIDILFLDAKGRIVATHKMKAEQLRKPGESQEDYEDRLKRYESKRSAQFAIELKAGTIERLKLKPGQQLSFDSTRLARIA